MNFKKIGVVVATGLTVITLASCGKNDANSDIVTMKGDTIRVTDLYAQTKEYPTTGASTLLQNMTFNKIFEKEFGKKVSDKEVAKEFDTQIASLGTNFASALQQAGYTESSYKDSIRSQLLLKAAVVDKIKFTDDAYKTAFETYHPEVSALILPQKSADDAKAKIADAQKSPDDFDKAAKEQKGDLKFDSASTSVPKEVMAAAFKLKDGEVSAEPITVMDPQTGASSFYVVKMVKNADKGTDWKKYKKELKAVITTTKQNDTQFVNSIITKYLKDYNVKVKPKEFANTFAAFESTTDSSKAKK
ncbi:MAG: peptidyl-prolyl cis-trans isomerase [Lactococcus sp.]|nr:peptidyl-prolyl cis-trans isomerase [Lactococcus sp.]